MRLSRLTLLLLGLWPLQGCLVAADLATIATQRPSQALLNRMAAMCRADYGLRTFGPMPSGVDLWIPGRLGRAPVDGDDLHDLKPIDSFWNSDEPWLRNGYARAIYADITPATTSSVAYPGPKKGDPVGVYRFELAPPDDPRCIARRKAVAEWDTSPPPRIAPVVTDTRCLVWTYVGRASAGPPQRNVFVRYDDEALKAQGIRRSGEVLLVDGKVRASFARYSAANLNSEYPGWGSWQTPACEKSTGRMPDDLPPPGGNGAAK
ncbi:hypothetical protein [Phenylobacterium sp. J367]|uniref:hypothetical protein n=1 Tax=Phenylobacterium sp. J367 TaxID=2898435 RepID=UPI0021509BB1|nr:hypothetical protein [Phenylobacterium sp. J367]MCR5881168.1 hypothetical protein [Phenylobacterium sp. J367]